MYGDFIAQSNKNFMRESYRQQLKCDFSFQFLCLIFQSARSIPNRNTFVHALEPCKTVLSG